MQTTLAMITSVLGWEGSLQAHAAAPAGPVRRARGGCWGAGRCGARPCQRLPTAGSDRMFAAPADVAAFSPGLCGLLGVWHVQGDPVR